MQLRTASKRLAVGFALVEVLIAMLVIAVGVLGFAKAGAASISSMRTARVRSLMALQVDSLASSMRSNSAFWRITPTSFSAHGATLTDPGTLSGTADCSDAACTPAEMAAYDVNSWIEGLAAQFPDYEASVECSTAAGAPVICKVDLEWSEQYVAINRTTAASQASQTATQTFTVHVQP